MMAVRSSSAPRRRPAAETREHILEVARELFYWHGIRATGIDTIARQAAVAPPTIYRLFASKDDLVAAYVEREAAGYRAWFDAAIDSVAADPAAPGRPGASDRERILAVFDALAEQLQPDRCRGCPFQLTLAETPGPVVARRHAAALKRWVYDRFVELARGAGAADPDGLAAELTLVLEGAYAVMQWARDVADGPADAAPGPARRARRLAERLLAADGSER